MDFFERNYYPNTGKNISGFLNHLKISIDKNKNTKNIEIMTYKKQDRPMCGCGNTQDPNGYCDGSHTKN